MYSNMNKLSLLVLSLWATTFVAGQKKGTSAASRMKALRQQCGKCNKVNVKALTSLTKDKKVADAFVTLYSSNDIDDLKNEITSIYESDIVSGDKDDDDDNDVIEAATIALFKSSQKKVQTSVNQVERQGPISTLVTIGTVIITVLGAITAILGIIAPDAEILTTLGTIITILSIIVGVLQFFTGFLLLGEANNASSSASATSKAMTQLQTSFTDMTCTAESLLCQVNIMKRQDF